jgi:hypothetical protein
MKIVVYVSTFIAVGIFVYVLYKISERCFALFYRD